MSQPTSRNIGHSERPWAQRRYVIFLGRYELHPASGLYFHQHTSKKNREKIAHAFLQCPAPLRRLAIKHGLTASTSDVRKTCAGNSATFYSSYSEGHNDFPTSPHIEFGNESLEDDLLVPHFTHELTHLWWACLTPAQRAAYKEYLRESTRPGQVEVTFYTQDLLDSYVKALELPDSFEYAENHRRSYLNRWAPESYCETVAALHVPTYAHNRATPTVDLNERRLKIRSITGLAVGRSTRPARAASSRR